MSKIFLNSFIKMEVTDNLDYSGADGIVGAEVRME